MSEATTTASDGRILLEVESLTLSLGSGAQRAQVLRGLSFAVPAGTTLGVVGESGSGKSTLAKTIVGVHRPDGGTVRFAGADVSRAGARERLRLRRSIQLIPQDPYSSLSPRRTIGQTLAEAISPRRPSVRRHAVRIAELLRLVGLDEDAATRFPRDFSGGQRQRIAIARALAVEPTLIIADEITSALDLSTQAQILDLLADLKRRLGITLVFVSHDLAVVRGIADDVVVLLHGEIVEQGPAEEVFGAPRSEYARTLIDSVPGGPGFSLEVPISS